MFMRTRSLWVSEDVRLGREAYSIDHQYSQPGDSLKTHDTLHATNYYVKTTFWCNNYVFVALCVCWDGEILPLESRRCQDANFLDSGATKVCVMVIYRSTGDDKIGNLTTFCFWCQFLSKTCLVDLVNSFDFSMENYTSASARVKFFQRKIERITRATRYVLL